MSINHCDSLKQTPLHISVIDKDMDTMTWLLSNGANVNAVDIFGTTSLSIACSKGDTDTIKLLLNHGANPNMSCPLPLFYAVSASNVDILKLLLKHGADVFLMSMSDLIKYLTIQSFHGYTEKIFVCVGLLVQHTLHVDYKDLLDPVEGVRATFVRDLNVHVSRYHTPPTVVPSLRELCRNRVRGCLRKNCHATGEFMNALKELRLPKVVNDIIRLKYPLGLSV